jgi:hypothetical protein
MRRRDFVKAMMAASVSAKAMLGQQVPLAAPTAPSATPIAPLPVPWMRGLMEVKPLPTMPLVADAVAETDAHFFNDRQMETLRRLSEILMPALNGYPGATDAGAPEFLDFLIGASPADRQQMYQSGLDRLDAEAKQKFNVPFVQVNSAQADQLIRPWLRTWMNDHPPTEPYARFINLVHRDIRTATANSQEWSEAVKAAGQKDPDLGLYWYPVDPDIHRGSTVPGVRSVSKKQQHS